METVGVEYLRGTLVGEKYKSGITFSFTVAKPSVPCEKYALWIEHDGVNEANVSALKRLADEGKAPYCVCVGVERGVIVTKDGTTRGMRMNSYDLFDREYGDFLVYELIPYIEKEFGIAFYADADMRCVSGGSSGGISSFVIAWFHSDYFHRVYMSSPSFLAMGRGNEIPYLIRKYETKPLRIYEEYSENEPNDYFGASFPIDVEAKMALEFAGYDFACQYFPNEGHCSRYRDEEEAYKRGEWLWRDYKTQKIVASQNSPRVERVVSINSVWEKCEKFPEKEVVTSPLLKRYTSVVKSNDGQFFYVADGKTDSVFTYIVEKENVKKTRLTHARLHTLPDVEEKGVLDMAVDKADRLYALTAIGIQCVRSFGLIDVILDLPKGKPLGIAVSDALYVKTDEGIYKRPLQAECLEESEEKRKFTSYYD